MAPPSSRQAAALPIAIGIASVLLLSAFCFGCFRDGVRILEYSFFGIHPSVARALYNGQLFLSDRPELGIPHDFEFHNGALYTHWGYGVPLLQMPFHLLATAFSSRPGFQPFPDRTIFLVYLLLGTLVFWLAMKSLAEDAFRLDEWGRSALATALTAFLLTQGLYWLITLYGRVYELTAAYLALVQFSAIAFFVLFRTKQRAAFLLALGATEGIGILVRSTGVFYFGLFLFLLCLVEGERRRKIVLYLLSASPFIVAWACFNYARTDTLLGSGLNTVFSEPKELHAFHFGQNPCFASIGDKLFLLAVYFSEVFSPWTSRFTTASLEDCGVRMVELASQQLPFVSPVVSLALLCVVATEIRRGNWAPLAPLAVPLAVIGFFVRSGLNFGARYMGDLWPALVLVLLTPLFRLEGLPVKPKWIAVASLLLLALSASRIAREVVPQFATIGAADRPEGTYLPASNFKLERASIANVAARGYRWTEVPFKPNPTLAVETFKACPPHSIAQFEMDASWWMSDCRTGAITPMFLALPEKPGGDFTLDIYYALLPGRPLRADRTLDVTVNGVRYSAPFDGVHAVIPFHLRKERLHSSLLPVVIRWVSSFSDSDVLLMRVDIR